MPATGTARSAFLAQESIDIMIEMGIDDLTPGTICRETPDYRRTSASTNFLWAHVFRFGETIQKSPRLARECHKGCAIQQKVGKCIMPTQGIFTKVIKEGTLHVGDPITVLEF